MKNYRLTRGRFAPIIDSSTREKEKMSQNTADQIIDLALELFGDDFTDEQLEAAKEIIEAKCE